MSVAYSFKLKPAHLPWLKLSIHLGALIPLVLTYYQAFSDQLGGDPVTALLHFTGLGAFKLLLLSLTITPLARTFKQGLLINVRRLLGLYSFAYAFAHLVSYVLFDLQLDWTLLLSEIIKRPYITVGFAAWLILFSLTLTSTKKAQRSLGRRWQTLHNFVYLAVSLVALHFLWSVKSGLAEPLIYMVMSAALLLYRRDKLQRLVTKRIKNGQKLKK
ncbi:protein-methionine-sulfoxide reductase heme-binding subunit MsrQ [Paraglaciecola polaris]|uniref:Protein-methionine-sulfoxide reductase heme-binding subunit MsrQ n=1 Tax=Paraglaciecola polaris LMG 21857 TaxID=1129793 RepID=K6Z9G6_9ALTE|nr:protein-methionine-sulfoxide reductase heme-binding subunit MsrQ [Paraglaciecola polaris]GAC32781.1 sulfoxide reductase heme-binding subunit yedZ [Paraglaciecola polaris LMG 21857]|tara:strand:- start:9571 stop:10218 length:648 start_codon:yes stop_codon:yes gene_type:complete